MNNNCVDCGVEIVECGGDEFVGTDMAAVICTHERCLACENKFIFGQGIAFPNTIQIQLGIKKSYYSSPERPDDEGMQTRMDVEGDDFMHVNELNVRFDPMTGNREPYESEAGRWVSNDEDRHRRDAE